MLCRLDDAVVATINGKITKRMCKDDKGDGPKAVALSDGEGLRGLFRGLAATKRKAKKL